ncbi:MAG: 23S rRNA (pseudouridine(1915)-N(3))-methyltransferase RlmH [Pseudopedobacter saltans]|uniref:Ribosomal RNA large subunit methyltransferase H n=1 Tax=Pseudopedobacter saltans TaxID=151895 RepID=A0A2W5F289_9SPHI|nr:MAG: 23S rRNA (pseudouridine(1915)-N(3))-methyltransferase RlmH [Pseudopedobacter saltans]
MKIQLWSLGKSHEKYAVVGIEDFTKRVNNYFSCEWKIIPPLKNAASLSEDQLKKQEGKILLDTLQSDDVLILLDERGKMLDSPSLAQLVQQYANQSSKKLVFLIGGAFGVDEQVFKRANFTWSLSKLVFPHMLVRMILSEQIYRACTILKGEKYHHI